MDTPPPAQRLKKELSFFSVFAIATGTTLSAGFFLLPGLAVVDAGPAVIVSYLIAAALLVPAMLSIVELATAMPRAGGAYYFLDRSIGPLAGTVGGMGTWLALTLKTAFALVGMGAYIELYFPQAPMIAIAVALAIFFGMLNLMGSKRSGGFQIILVCLLLALLVGFIGHGGWAIERPNFAGFFDKGGYAVFSTAGLVFISYVGVTKVASLAEEVHDPERNLPRGVFVALGTSVLIYALGITVMVGHVPVDALVDAEGQPTAAAFTPMAEAARTFAGRFGMAVISIAAVLAFSSVANGGILSSSRYPLAMSRDHLLPRFFRKLNSRGTPVRSVIFTVLVVVAFILFLDVVKIAKLASAFQLLMFALLCGAVIVMRESKIESYDPGYRSPLYPWMQIVGIVAPLFFIGIMGWLPIVFTSGLIAVGALWYRYYARSRVERHGAIYHVFERLGRRRFEALDSELRGIIKEKGLRADDPFDKVVAQSFVIEASPDATFEELTDHAAELLAQRLPQTAPALGQQFLEGTRVGATPVTKGVALPHIRVDGIDIPHLVLVRVQVGIVFEIGEGRHSDPTYALFYLASPDADPGQHLRLLAQLAGRVDQDDFMSEWRAADEEADLRKILLRNEHHISVTLEPGSPWEEWIGSLLKDIQIPQGCLVALVGREGRTLVPRGSTQLHARDHLTIIGEVDEIRDLYERQDRGDAAHTPLD